MYVRATTVMAGNVLAVIVVSACLTKPNPAWDLGEFGSTSTDEAFATDPAGTLDPPPASRQVSSVGDPSNPSDPDEETEGFDSEQDGSECSSVYSTDFEGMGPWEFGPGWFQSSGELIYDRCDEGEAFIASLVRGRRWRDASIGVRLAVGSCGIPGLGGIVARVQPSKACDEDDAAVYCAVDAMLGRLVLGVRTVGCDEAPWETSTPLPPAMNADGSDGWDLELSLDGHVAECRAFHVTSDAHGTGPVAAVVGSKSVGLVDGGRMGVFALDAAMQAQAFWGACRNID